MRESWPGTDEDSAAGAVGHKLELEATQPCCSLTPKIKIFPGRNRFKRFSSASFSLVVNRAWMFREGVN